MDTLRSPGALASLVARHAVPVAGVLFLGWPAGNVLVLLALDTLLALTALGLLVMIHVTGFDDHDGPLEGHVPWGKVLLALPIMLLLFALPVGIPFAAIAGAFDWQPEALTLPELQVAIAVQLAASSSAFVQLHRSLDVRYDDETVLARQFMFQLARWVVLSFVVFAGVAGLFGPRFGGALLLLVYGAASVWFELFPREAARFIRGRGAKPLEQVIAESTVRSAREAARRRNCRSPK